MNEKTVQTTNYTSKIYRVNNDINWDLTGPLQNNGSYRAWWVLTPENVKEFTKMLRSTAAQIDVMFRMGDE